MDDHNKLVALLISCGTMVAITAIVSIAYYNNHQVDVIKAMIDKGVDPIAAKCTFEPGYSICSNLPQVRSTKAPQE